jgi:hypothetical protein
MKSFTTFRCVCCAVALGLGLSAAVSEASTITPVSATASSSFSDRTPVKSINGSGLASGLHDNNASNMWLTDINLAINDPWITYDLGANYTLGSFHVWNYNESSANRGVKDVEIFTSSTATPGPTDWVSRGIFTLSQATGAAGYAGQSVGFSYDNVRLVKFDIASNWKPFTYPSTYPAGSSPYDYNAVTGLSEIRFYAPVPFFRDTFDNKLPATSYPSDMGLNQELATRQSGADTTLNYVRVAGDGNRFQVNRTDTGISAFYAPGKLILFTDSVQPSVTAAVDNNFGRDTTLTVTIDPVVEDTQSSDWLAFGLRGQTVALDNGNLIMATNAGVVFGVRSTGNWFVEQNGDQNYLFSSTPVTPNADGSFDLVLSVAGNQFSATVNGVVLDLNGTSAGTSLTLTGLAAGLNNYISFGSSFVNDGFGLYSTYKGFTLDNLAVVPEPASGALACAGLLALGLVGCLQRKLRRPQRG